MEPRHVCVNIFITQLIKAHGKVRARECIRKIIFISVPCCKDGQKTSFKTVIKWVEECDMRLSCDLSRLVIDGKSASAVAKLDLFPDRKCTQRQCALCIQWILENCICCLDNWVNERNLDQKWDICHFNEGDLSFFVP